MKINTTTGTAIVTNVAGLITVRDEWSGMVLGATRHTGRRAVKFLKSVGLSDFDAKRAVSL